MATAHEIRAISEQPRHILALPREQKKNQHQPPNKTVKASHTKRKKTSKIKHENNSKSRKRKALACFSMFYHVVRKKKLFTAISMHTIFIMAT